jgi:hypothetical protein
LGPDMRSVSVRDASSAQRKARLSLPLRAFFRGPFRAFDSLAL